MEAVSEKRLTPSQFKALAKYKGWKYVMLAERWGLTPVWVSNIARDPNRPIRYDDMLHGLPNLNRRARELARRENIVAAAESKLKPRPPARKPHVTISPGFRYRGYVTLGAILTASAYVGSIADEGMRGIVFQVICDKHEERYGVIFETGMWDWFAPAHVDQYLATTGMSAPTIDVYRYRDEDQLQKDFASGLFHFWPAA